MNKKTMTRTEINNVLCLHKAWLENLDEGKCADFSYKNLSGIKLAGKNLSMANFTGANLYEADLYGTKFSRANFYGANFVGAELSEADFSDSDLGEADFRGANLSGTILIRANLSGAKNLRLSTDYMEKTFEHTSEGYIVYKTFGDMYDVPDNWKIKPGSIITENVDFNRTNECGCGINVATLEWVRNHHDGTVWKLLIEWPWLSGVVVPYNTEGKIRCEKARLLEIVK